MPRRAGAEAQWASDDLDILAPRDLPALIAHFAGSQILAPIAPLRSEPEPEPADLADVKGMPVGRRALEIAAAGGHSLLMVGPPGAGKSMLAARLVSILPDMTREQTLESSCIHSAHGQLHMSRLISRPPFRTPHHSATLAALVGGGTRSRPGEVSLAHNGVLFLDELPEFSRQCLEALRQPIETGRISVARANQTILYPARFQLVAAMNPCRCGYLGDAERRCRKAPRCGEDYTARISGPMMDRLDLLVYLQPVSSLELSQKPTGEASTIVRKRVEQAQRRQLERQGSLNHIADPEAFELTDHARAMLAKAGERLRLSARGVTKIVRVARTLADLASHQTLTPEHVYEALSFRHRW